MNNKPKLRFKEFTTNYSEVKLSEITNRIKRKNRDLETSIPLTIASLEGLIDQREYFDKPIASKDLSNYYLIYNGEFAYNKSYSKGYPVGSIKRLDKYSCGALSTLYFCFNLKNNSPYNSDYLAQYFESTKWHKKVKNICAEGARNHGLLNVPVDEFYEIKHLLTSDAKEQYKIAQFLQFYDMKIDNQRKKVKLLRERKDGILNKLFKMKLRFNNEKFDDWNEVLLSNVLKERKEKSKGNEDVYSVSVSKGLINQIEHLGRSYAAENTSNYNVVHEGDVIYTKSPTGEFKWGIVKQSNVNKNVIISPLYGVFIPLNKEIGYIVDAYFSSSIRAHNYLITQIRKGAKNTINVTNQEFLNKKIWLPSDTKEQKKISDFIRLLNDQISVEEMILEKMILVKKGLLQKMFI